MIHDEKIKEVDSLISSSLSIIYAPVLFVASAPCPCSPSSAPGIISFTPITAVLPGGNSS